MASKNCPTTVQLSSLAWKSAKRPPARSRAVGQTRPPTLAATVLRDRDRLPAARTLADWLSEGSLTVDGRLPPEPWRNGYTGFQPFEAVRRRTSVRLVRQRFPGRRWAVAGDHPGAVGDRGRACVGSVIARANRSCQTVIGSPTHRGNQPWAGPRPRRELHLASPPMWLEQQASEEQGI